MNILDEIHNDRLAIDYIQPYVFIREDLYQELLDTSMFPHALRVIKLPWWKKLLVRLYLKLTRKSTETLIYQTFLHHLLDIRQHINEHRQQPPSINAIPDDAPLNFAITDNHARPLRVGYQLQNSWHHRPWTVDSSLSAVGKS